MKRTKKTWGLKPKHRRHDNFNWDFMTAFDWFYYGPAPSTETHGSRRMYNRIACRKIEIGFTEDEVYLHPKKWKRYPDYY